MIGKEKQSAPDPYVMVIVSRDNRDDKAARN